jgi:hypothetical protein
MTISFGKPGQLRKTFADAKLEIQGGVYFRHPCPLVPAFNKANLKDGFFLAAAAGGKFDLAADANRALYLIFTSNSEVIIAQPTSDDEFPGDVRTDSPTGLYGSVQAVFPIELLHTGARGTATVSLSSYTVGTALTVVNGKLCPANIGGLEGDRVVGYVEAESSVTGTNSVQCRVSL